MELWFSDYHTEKVKVSVKVQKQLFGLQTEFQRIDVFDSDEFGRFLSADGSIVFSEKDEFIYDEMVVHIPMAVHPNVKHVLVIAIIAIVAFKGKVQDLWNAISEGINSL